MCHQVKKLFPKLTLKQRLIGFAICLGLAGGLALLVSGHMKWSCLECSSPTQGVSGRAILFVQPVLLVPV